MNQLAAIAIGFAASSLIWLGVVVLEIGSYQPAAFLPGFAAIGCGIATIALGVWATRRG